MIAAEVIVTMRIRPRVLASMIVAYGSCYAVNAEAERSVAPAIGDDRLEHFAPFPPQARSSPPPGAMQAKATGFPDSGEQSEASSPNRAGFSIASTLPESEAGLGVDEFDRAMKEWVRANNVHAASLAVMKNDRLVLAKGYGTRKADDRVPIWSLSKAITGFCVASLIGEGKLNLGTTVGNLLDRIRPVSKSLMDPRFDDITVAELLTQRSGLPRDVEPGNLFLPGTASLLRHVRLEKARYYSLAPFVMKEKLVADPGEEFIYSNLNFALLGQIIEAVTREPYVQACNQRVLKRVGIENAGLAPRWGGLAWSAGGWALSGPEYLSFMRAWREPILLNEAMRDWFFEPEGKWTSSSHTEFYAMGVFIRPTGMDRSAWGLAHTGAMSWHQPDAAGGPIDESFGSLAVSLADGTTWFASFDGVDGGSTAASDLNRNLILTDRIVRNWGDEDLFKSITSEHLGGR